MKLLGISTAAKITSVGLVDDDKVLAEFSSSDVQSEDLVILIERIMKESDCDINKIEAISVAQGPGSYSGLRGGLAAAKSLAQVLNKPIVGISTLEAMAFNLVDIEGTIAVILDAIRDEFNFAMFTSDSKKLRRITEDFVVPGKRIQELLKEIKGEIYLVSSLEQNNVLPVQINESIKFADRSHSLPYGINVARIGLEKIKSGEKDDYLSLFPEYSHMPNIKTWNSKKQNSKT